MKYYTSLIKRHHHRRLALVVVISCVIDSVFGFSLLATKAPTTEENKQNVTTSQTS